MPVYNVNRGANGVWNLPAGPAPALPTAQLALGGASQAVAMSGEVNVALGAGVTGLHTFHLTACSAICILWQNPLGVFVRGALNHMAGGPDLNAVNWANMMFGMGGVGGTYWAILANSQPTVLTAGFVAGIPNVPVGNIWVYDANHPGGAINFGFDQNGFAGELLLPILPPVKVKPKPVNVSLPKTMKSGFSKVSSAFTSLGKSIGIKA